MSESRNSEAVAASPPPLLLNAAEVGRLCGISTATVWRWDAAGWLPRPVRLGGTTRWRAADLAAWTDAGCPDRTAWQAMQEVAADRRPARRKEGCDAR